MPKTREQQHADETADAFTDAFSALPPRNWEGATDNLHRAALDELTKDLCPRALHAARLAAYVNARATGSTHAQAVAKANHAVTMLAAALGYAYPRSLAIDF